MTANILLSPMAEIPRKTIPDRVRKRCRQHLSGEVLGLLKYRVFHTISEFPITGSGKRNIRALEEMD